MKKHYLADVLGTNSVCWSWAGKCCYHEGVVSFSKSASRVDGDKLGLRRAGREKPYTTNF